MKITNGERYRILQDLYIKVLNSMEKEELPRLKSLK